MNYFHMLQRREQILVAGAGILVLVAALFTFVIDPILVRAANLERRLATASRQLAELQILRGDYQRQKQIIDGIDAQFEAAEEGFRHFFASGTGGRADRHPGQDSIHEYARQSAKHRL